MAVNFKLGLAISVSSSTCSSKHAAVLRVFELTDEQVSARAMQAV